MKNSVSGACLRCFQTAVEFWGHFGLALCGFCENGKHIEMYWPYHVSRANTGYYLPSVREL